MTLTEIKELLEKATPGPWYDSWEGDEVTLGYEAAAPIFIADNKKHSTIAECKLLDVRKYQNTDSIIELKANAKLIAIMREAVPNLIAALEVAVAEINNKTCHCLRLKLIGNRCNRCTALSKINELVKI